MTMKGINPRARRILDERDRIRIAPSVLAADFGSIRDQVREAEIGGADCLHMDVMDGHFVPNLTIGPDIVAAVRDAVNIAIDSHLMITNPLDYVEKFVRAGSDIVCIHVESQGDTAETLDLIHDLGAAAGLTLNPETPLSDIEPYMDKCDLVLVMTVHPGFGGQKFMPEPLEKCREVAARWGIPVAVDGGVGTKNAGLCAASGAEILIAGTAVFRRGDISRAIEELRHSAGHSSIPPRS
jgi:ribulose-phosphate 3-epimerase